MDQATLLFSPSRLKCNTVKNYFSIKEVHQKIVITITKLLSYAQQMLPGAAQPVIDISKLQLGEVSSFHLLYQLFYSELAQMAGAMLAAQEAHSLVNHCFIKCWLKSEALTSMNYVTAFLHTTFRNSCREPDRNAFRSVHYTTILHTVLNYKIESGSTRKGLFSKITCLTNDQLAPARAIFSRFYGHQMLVNEIAADLDLGPVYVQEQLHLAYEVLHLILSVEII